MNNYTHNVEDLKKEVWALKKGQMQTQAEFESLGENISQLDSDIAGLESEITSISSGISTTNANLSTLSSSIASVQSEVSSLKTSTESEIEEIHEIIDARNYGMTYMQHLVCRAVGSTTGSGYIDFQIADTVKIRIYFGLISSEDTVTFSTPFSSVIWGMSSDASLSDSKSYRSTIKSISSTTITFYGGADVMTRYEAWGIINF